MRLDRKNGTITSSQGNGYYSVSIGGAFPVPFVSSIYNDYYAEGMDVVLGYINADSPQIISRGFARCFPVSAAVENGGGVEDTVLIPMKYYLGNFCATAWIEGLNVDNAPNSMVEEDLQTITDDEGIVYMFDVGGSDEPGLFDGKYWYGTENIYKFDDGVFTKVKTLSNIPNDTDLSDLLKNIIRPFNLNFSPHACTGSFSLFKENISDEYSKAQISVGYDGYVDDGNAYISMILNFENDSIEKIANQSATGVIYGEDAATISTRCLPTINSTPQLMKRIFIQKNTVPPIYIERIEIDGSLKMHKQEEGYETALDPFYRHKPFQWIVINNNDAVLRVVETDLIGYTYNEINIGTEMEPLYEVTITGSFEVNEWNDGVKKTIQTTDLSDTYTYDPMMLGEEMPTFEDGLIPGIVPSISIYSNPEMVYPPIMSFDDRAFYFVTDKNKIYAILDPYGEKTEIEGSGNDYFAPYTDPMFILGIYSRISSYGIDSDNPLFSASNDEYRFYYSGSNPDSVYINDYSIPIGLIYNRNIITLKYSLLDWKFENKTDKSVILPFNSTNVTLHLTRDEVVITDDNILYFTVDDNDLDENGRGAIYVLGLDLINEKFVFCYKKTDIKIFPKMQKIYIYGKYFAFNVGDRFMLIKGEIESEI